VEETNCRTVISSKTSARTMTFEKGETPFAKISDLLEMAGISLDDENTDSGGVGVATGTNEYWPRYRVTGAAIQFQTIYGNTRFERPFDFEPNLEIEVSLVSANQWASKGPRVMTMAQTDGWGPVSSGWLLIVYL
jgi:hypothetical protein